MLRLKAIRKANHMSVTNLAKAVGVTCMSIWRWENGARMPSVRMLQKLAETLGVTPNELLGVTEAQEKEVS